jgi:hypothetical protein
MSFANFRRRFRTGATKTNRLGKGQVLRPLATRRLRGVPAGAGSTRGLHLAHQARCDRPWLSQAQKQIGQWDNRDFVCDGIGLGVSRSKKWARVSFAIQRATVVLPHCRGPRIVTMGSCFKRNRISETRLVRRIVREAMVCILSVGCSKCKVPPAKGGSGMRSSKLGMAIASRRPRLRPPRLRRGSRRRTAIGRGSTRMPGRSGRQGRVGSGALRWPGWRVSTSVAQGSCLRWNRPNRCAHLRQRR